MRMLRPGYSCCPRLATHLNARAGDGRAPTRSSCSCLEKVRGENGVESARVGTLSGNPLRQNVGEQPRRTARLRHSMTASCRHGIRGRDEVERNLFGCRHSINFSADASRRDGIHRFGSHALDC